MEPTLSRLSAAGSSRGGCFSWLQGLAVGSSWFGSSGTTRHLPNTTQPSCTLPGPKVPRVSPAPKKGRVAQGYGNSAHPKPQPRRQGSSVCCWEGKPKSHRDCASRGVSWCFHIPYSPLKEEMVLEKPLPCPLSCPAPGHPPQHPHHPFGHGSPLPIELRRSLSRQHCPDS